MRRLKVVSSLLFLIISVVSRSDAAEPRKLTFAYSSVGPMAAGVWMAKEAKIFEKYGLATDVIFISSGPVVVQALLSGDLQGASAASNAAIAAILSGAPLALAPPPINLITACSYSRKSVESKTCAARPWA